MGKAVASRCKAIESRRCADARSPPNQSFGKPEVDQCASRGNYATASALSGNDFHDALQETLGFIERALLRSGERLAMARPSN